MGIFSVYIINKAGGLIYQYDHVSQRPEAEKTFSYPLELVLKLVDDKVVVAFGERDGIKVGHTLLAVNGIPLEGRYLQTDGQDAMEIIAAPENYPINLKFGRTRLTTNERIMLASMFHSTPVGLKLTIIEIVTEKKRHKLFAIGSQLSPEHHSSGIEVLETDGFKLQCYQTMTGIKFIVIADPRQTGLEVLLRKMYEVYSDFALKNPFYSLDMPIRCDLFDTNLQQVIETAERQGNFNV